MTTQVADAIRTAVEERLGWDCESLGIEVDQGQVTLTGSVEWTSDAIRLIRLVRDLDGVVELVSEVRSEHRDVVLVPAA
ncbi:BON domain-containing protein [Nonomuraea soli]|uniref:Osmotically-inducible protein OsmY n=1 Tax=Nonomuraea soli TaxID=1032476 RepID=A0A7W0HNQ4_9ACTN|nr:BON domain-containing protein [Nonomuraea soli]MBA2890050.1 osmotically-inducible protein OsmY [Nonomuraea soli]